MTPGSAIDDLPHAPYSAIEFNVMSRFLVSLPSYNRPNDSEAILLQEGSTVDSAVLPILALLLSDTLN